MNPAYSVVFFTTASGAGYGLLALLGLGLATGRVPADRWFGAVGLALALALVSAGLLSSAAHLGRPERAWRAFSQWRSSWLSREGIAAVATYLPAAALGLGWIVLGKADGWVAAAALLAALGAVVTVTATAMIYAVLKPIPQWNSPLTLPVYLALAALSGAILLDALLHVFGEPSSGLAAACAVLAFGAWALKRTAWRRNDRRRPAVTLASATGLGSGPVRSVEWPHTEENFILKEMGYRIARKHRTRLRRIAELLAFALPALLSLVAIAAPGMPAALAAVAAVPLQLAGTLVERWLFFAEAEHVAALYYGRGSESGDQSTRMRGSLVSGSQ